MNEFEQAEASLREFTKLSIPEQQERKADIVEAFDLFWRSNPKRFLFGEVCSGLLLTPEMLWIMVKTG